MPWWDPAADASVQPEVDAVLIDGVRVSRGSIVRVHPSRRADAQDLFFAGQLARVTAVLSDVDGNVHVALVLLDDPAARPARVVRPLLLLRTRRARADARRDRSQPRGESIVRTLGRLTALVGLAAGAVVAVVGLQSIPDIKRYLKMRSM